MVTYSKSINGNIKSNGDFNVPMMRRCICWWCWLVRISCIINLTILRIMNFIVASFVLINATELVVEGRLYGTMTFHPSL